MCVCMYMCIHIYICVSCEEVRGLHHIPGLFISHFLRQGISLDLNLPDARLTGPRDPPVPIVGSAGACYHSCSHLDAGDLNSGVCV